MQKITALDDSSYKTRELASRDLERYALWAEPLLRKTLAEPISLEHQMRIRQVLKKLERPEPQPDPDELRWLRVLVVLEQIGTFEARQIVEHLATGAPESPLTQEARQVLQTMKSSANAAE
jgi:hypothetical protein